ncbi:MAG: hypothetical protein H7240_03705 [Glaciimonas sp.]|nr:hypothetical protein [Glaciimonas sp.]
MGIVNAGMIGIYDSLPAELREQLENFSMNRREDATERMVDIASTLKAGAKKEEETLEWSAAPCNNACRMRWCRASRNGLWKIPKKHGRNCWAMTVVRSTLSKGR